LLQSFRFLSLRCCERLYVEFMKEVTGIIESTSVAFSTATRKPCQSSKPATSHSLFEMKANERTPNRVIL
jgi:hypothetical protein